MSASLAWARALAYTRQAAGSTLPGLLPELASRFGSNTALIDQRETLTYDELNARVCRYAEWALSEGLQANDIVGLLMSNQADYLAIWIGLTRIGCTVALLNTNLQHGPLQHCIRVGGLRCVIAEPGLVDRALGMAPVWNWAEIRDRRVDSAVRPALPQPGDRALLIYTSGTTGMPKAVNITHRRIVEWSFWFAGMMHGQPSDRLFDCLPMYHSVGGIVAPGAMLAAGGSVVIRKRFSASRFWDDVCDTECTMFQYIGELCRYLAQSPTHPRERQHKLRLACGNGMQGPVWTALQDRFAIPQVLEFYAATEGHLSLYNCEGRPGAIGRVPPFLAKQLTIAIIRVDPETGAPERSADNFCIRCQDNEPGEAISLMQARPPDFYTDAQANKRKILQNVFAEGDLWFRSGDLMRRDQAGFFYFVDRLGDTFRWKGENVSTAEVANVLTSYAGVEDAVVYGVHIPGAEGRAGMAAIVVNDGFGFAGLEAYLEKNLPNYACPVFIRVCSALASTGTFKLIKTDLARESIEGGSDPVWQRDRSGVYRPLNPSAVSFARPHAETGGSR